MKAALAWFFGILAVFALIFALTFAGNAFGLWNLNFWGVKFQNAQTNIFKEGQSHIDAISQEVSKNHLEANQDTDPKDVRALCEATLHDVAGERSLSYLSEYDMGFIDQCRNPSGVLGQ